MLELIVGGKDSWDEAQEVFVVVGGKRVQFEHSLVSLSKWEQKFEKPFLGAGEKTDNEAAEYVRCMAVSDFSPEDLLNLSPQNVNDINDYVESKGTATTFTNTGKKPEKNREQVTSELIYYWLILHQIPFECENWFLNRLLTLIQICEVKAEEQEARSKRRGRAGKRLSHTEAAQMATSRTEENARRRAALGSRG